MDLLKEAKHSNKMAFNKLVENYHHILYKTARVYLKREDDINKIIKETLAKAYSDIVNVKCEEDFLPWVLQILIPKAKKLSEEYKEDFLKDFEKEFSKFDVSFDINDKISLSSTNRTLLEYKKYRDSSIVEEYITSIDENFRLIAILYYYADLPITTIAKILKVPEFTIHSKLEKIRVQLYEMIKTKEADL